VLLALVPNLVQYCVSGLGLVSLSKYLLISCFSLAFPTSEYCNEMLKAVSPTPSVTVVGDVIEELKSKLWCSMLLSSDVLYDILKH